MFRQRTIWLDFGADADLLSFPGVVLLPATLGSVTYGSFTEMYEVLARVRESGDLPGALAVTEDHLGSFPHSTGLMHLTHAELLAASGRATDALDTLDRALRAGCRYPEKALRANRSLAAAAELPAFAEICARSQRQWEEAVASSSPQRTLLSPTNGAGDRLLVVLHGNNSDAAETIPRWSSAVDDGWSVAVLQSSEPGTTPGSFTWNDRERTGAEVEAHLSAIRSETGVSLSRLVLGGFSMGALQVIALPLTGRLHVSGVISVAPWLPHVREFAALAADGKATFVPTWVIVGRNDPSYDGAKQLVELAAAHGGRALLDERDGLGHEYPDDMTSTLMRALRFVADTEGLNS